MRHVTIGFLSAVLFLATAGTLRADLFWVMRLTDLRGNVSFQVCTDADKRKLETDLSAEERAFPKALEATRAEWKLAHAETPFPAGRIHPRTLRETGSTMVRDEADKLLAQNKAREERTLAHEKEEAENAAKPHPGLRRANRAAIEAKAKEQKEERERNEAADRAEPLVRQKLSAAVGHDIPFYGASASTEEPKKPGGHPHKKK
jgi:hypothetical protein